MDQVEKQFISQNALPMMYFVDLQFIQFLILSFIFTFQFKFLWGVVNSLKTELDCQFFNS